MVDRKSVEDICQRIRKDGRKEIDSILDKAGRTAASIVEKAGKEAEQVAEEIVREGKNKGESARRRILSSVNIEVKRTSLKAREEVISEVNRRVKRRLAEIREEDRYSAILLKLSREAINSLEGRSFVVYLDRRDIDLFNRSVLDGLREMEGREGEPAEIEARPLEGGTAGGVKVGVPRGNVIFDNTFEGRMYRMREDIRNVIFQRIFAKKGEK